MLPEWVPFVMVAVAAPFTLLAARRAWRGEFRPNLVTWSLWAAAPLVAGFAALTSGAGTSSVSTIAAGVGPLIIIAASLAGPHRELRWPVTAFDVSCGLLALVGVAGWVATGSGLVAVCCAVAADAAAAVPTYRKAWTQPASETALGYVAGLLTGVTALATLDVWVPANWLFPAWLVALSASLMIIIAVPRRRVPPTTTA